MNYFWTSMSAYDDKFTGMADKDVTPENLRAAAKVLEDKAKELETPKLTDGQDKLLKWAVENNVLAVKRHGGKGYRIVERINKEHRGQEVGCMETFEHVYSSDCFWDKDKRIWIDYVLVKSEYGSPKMYVEYS